MNCESCGISIGSEMKAAFRNNSCPFCGGEIMDPLKAEQYINLVEVLQATTFTTKIEVDQKIREKVVSLLVSNFVFKKIDPPSNEADLIEVDSVELVTSSSASESSSLVKSKFTTATSEVSVGHLKQQEQNTQVEPKPVPRTLSSQKKTTHPPEPNLSIKDFLIDPTESLDRSDLEEDLSPEEIKKFFPTLSDNEIEEVKTQAGKGIRRL